MSATSQRAINIVVRQPLTMVALAITMSSVYGIHTWFSPSAIYSLLTIVLGIVVFLSWPLIYTKTEEFAKLMYDVSDTVTANSKEHLETLITELEALGSKQGLQQASQLQKKFDNLVDVLKRRLNVNETTYRRYAGMAEQVYLASLDNLNEASICLRSVSAIDSEELKKRMTELQGCESEKERQELEALNQRLGLLEDQNSRAASLLAQNETAMTLLDKTAGILADTKTEKGQASVDAETAMMELERIAKQTNKYAR